MSPDPEFEKQHLDKCKWQESSSKTKTWAARFKAGVDEGHQKGPGGELGTDGCEQREERAGKSKTRGKVVTEMPTKGSRVPPKGKAC